MKTLNNFILEHLECPKLSILERLKLNKDTQLASSNYKNTKIDYDELFDTMIPIFNFIPNVFKLIKNSFNNNLVNFLDNYDKKDLEKFSSEDNVYEFIVKDIKNKSNHKSIIKSIDDLKYYIELNNNKLIKEFDDFIL